MGLLKESKMNIYDFRPTVEDVDIEGMYDDVRLVMETITALSRARMMVGRYKRAQSVTNVNTDVYNFTMETINYELGVPDGVMLSEEGLLSATYKFSKKLWKKIVQVWRRIKATVLDLIGFGDSIEEDSIEESVDEAKAAAAELAEIERLNSGPIPDNIKRGNFDNMNTAEVKEEIDNRVAAAKALLYGKYRIFNIEFMNHSYVSTSIGPNLLSNRYPSSSVPFTTFTNSYSKVGDEIRVEKINNDLTKYVDLVSYLRYGKELTRLVKRINYAGNILTKRHFHDSDILSEDVVFLLSSEITEDIKVATNALHRWKMMYKGFNKNISFLKKISKMNEH